MSLSIRKGPTYTGRMRLPDTYHVKRDGEEVAIIQRRVTGSDLWFWYTMGQESHVNTSRSPAPLENCKAAVKEWFRNNQRLS